MRDLDLFYENKDKLVPLLKEILERLEQLDEIDKGYGWSRAKAPFQTNLDLLNRGPIA